MREIVIHNARRAATTLATLSRSETAEREPKTDGKMKIVTLARRVAMVRTELERRASKEVDD